MSAEKSGTLEFRHLYLDANILRNEGWPRISAKLENVLSLARSVNVTVNLPEAVERELEANWMRGYKAKCENLQEHLDPLRNHLNRLAEKQVPSVTLPEEAKVLSG